MPSIVSRIFSQRKKVRPIPTCPLAPRKLKEIREEVEREFKTQKIPLSKARKEALIRAQLERRFWRKLENDIQREVASNEKDYKKRIWPFVNKKTLLRRIKHAEKAARGTGRYAYSAHIEFNRLKEIYEKYYAPLPKKMLINL